MRGGISVRVVLAASLLLLTGCIGQDGSNGMSLRSDAFASFKQIPTRYTCDGENVSPPLAWSGAPGDARAFALVVTDVDAKDFVHWVVVDVPAGTTELAEAASGSGIQGVEATNDFKQTGWGGPCPGLTGVHTYRFTLYALSAPLGLGDSPDADAVTRALDDAGKVLARAELNGIYARAH